MNRNHFQFILLSLAIVLGVRTQAVEFEGGTGEPNDPYLIATAEQLREADFSESGVYFELCCNIDLDRSRIPARRFRAHLDGAGYEIQNAVVVLEPSLFGIIEAEGTIRNLTLADLDLGIVPVWEGETIGGSWIGGLASRNYGAITNCGVTGWIVTQSAARVGGFVGHNEGSITNCYFDGWVSTDWEDADVESGIGVWSPSVGGLAARNSGAIANSFANAIVVGKAGCGGLVGHNSGTIRNCYGTCFVLGGVGAGGLVSVNSGSLHRCYAAGWVTGQMRGGLVGMADWYGGAVVGCLWDQLRTGCQTSGGGVGVFDLGSGSPVLCALNGWAGDPNWVVLDELRNFENLPRIAWEGTAGGMIPPPWPNWGPSSGNGTEADPYLVRTESDLLDMCIWPVSWDKHFVLVEDLDLKFDRSLFSPIGVCLGSSFSGTFDGNGHVIRNVTFDADEATIWNAGVFGYVTGEVRNLRVENVEFTGGMNSRRVGLLAGTCEGVIK
ncbi:MAG: GLUG motif-containing protein, partial [Planctomycetota bacterium]